MTEQPLCAGCLEPITEPNLIQQIELEAQYRKDYGKDATNDDVQRVLLCQDCLAKLQAIKDQKKANA